MTKEWYFKIAEKRLPPILHILSRLSMQSYNYSRREVSHLAANSELYVTITCHTAPRLILAQALTAHSRTQYLVVTVAVKVLQIYISVATTICFTLHVVDFYVIKGSKV